jgi:hypothetical protein
MKSKFKLSEVLDEKAVPSYRKALTLPGSVHMTKDIVDIQ